MAEKFALAPSISGSLYTKGRPVPTADNFEKLVFLVGNLHLLNKNWPSSVVEMDEEIEKSVFQTNMVLFPLDLKKKNKLGGKE